MFFFFKKKKVVVDCFTADDSVYNLYKIRRAIVYYPDEIKKLPSEFLLPFMNSNIDVPVPSLKRCTGISEWYKHGAIIPLWLDFICDPEKHQAGRAPLGITDHHYLHQLENHSPIQWQDMFNDFFHIKFINPWRFRENGGIKHVWVSAFYNLQKHLDNFVIPPGIMWWDFQNQANINTFIRKNSKPFTIIAGTPLIHMIPITEKEVKYKTHLVTQQELDKIKIIPNTFSSLGSSSRNNKFFKARDEANRLDELESKFRTCPFGFGKNETKVD